MLPHVSQVWNISWVVGQGGGIKLKGGKPETYILQLLLALSCSVFFALHWFLQLMVVWLSISISAVIPVLIFLCLLRKSYRPQIAMLCPTTQVTTIHEQMKITKQVEKDPTEERTDIAKCPMLASSKVILAMAISLPRAKCVRCSECTLCPFY
jgi:hypothetical protein